MQTLLKFADRYTVPAVKVYAFIVYGLIGGSLVLIKIAEAYGV